MIHSAPLQSVLPGQRSSQEEENTVLPVALRERALRALTLVPSPALPLALSILISLHNQFLEHIPLSLTLGYCTLFPLPRLFLIQPWLKFLFHRESFSGPTPQNRLGFPGILGLFFIISETV